MPTKRSSISNRDRLIYLHIKHRGVWDDIQFDVATAAELDPDDVRKVLDSYRKAHKDHQFVTYIDENYPKLLTTMDKPMWVLEYTGTLPSELDTLDSVSLADSDGWHPIVWLDSGDLAEYFGTHSVPSIWHDDATQLTYVNMGDASNGCAQTAGIVDPTWSLCELANVAAATSDNSEFVDQVHKSAAVQLRLALPSEAGSLCNQLIKSGAWALFDDAEDITEAGVIYKWQLSR